MPDSGKSNSTLVVLAAAGTLTVVNSALLFYLYKKYKQLWKRHGELASKFELSDAEKAGQIAALKASIHSLSKAAPPVGLQPPVETSSISDSEYQDAIAEQQPDSIVNRPMSPNLLEQVDSLYDECKYSEIYNTLIKDSSSSSDPEILWRLARVCYQMASPLELKNPKKKNLLDEGHKYASVAYEKKPDEFDTIKWLAAVTGGRTDFLGTKEKIEQGNVFKSLLDKALAMKPEEFSLLYMRGRFCYSIASLSWLERKAAATFFASPPEASYDDAIQDFAAVAVLKPDWMENLLYLAKCYLAKGDKDAALEWLRKAAAMDERGEDGEETEAQKEAKALLKKHDK